jgi:hypothetical protein
MIYTTSGISCPIVLQIVITLVLTQFFRILGMSIYSASKNSSLNSRTTELQNFNSEDLRYAALKQSGGPK